MHVILQHKYQACFGSDFYLYSKSGSHFRLKNPGENITLMSVLIILQCHFTAIFLLMNSRRNNKQQAKKWNTSTHVAWPLFSMFQFTSRAVYWSQTGSCSAGCLAIFLPNHAVQPNCLLVHAHEFYYLRFLLYNFSAQQTVRNQWKINVMC